MGGCTISRVADTLESLFSIMEEQIMDAECSGLGVDSELIVIDLEKQIAGIYRVDIQRDETRPFSYLKGVKFVQVDSGRAFHIDIAGVFGPKPKAGQIVGTVHVHT